jgi:hypothetical protein
MLFEERGTLFYCGGNAVFEKNGQQNARCKRLSDTDLKYYVSDFPE